jgi:hypothetical protein
MAVHGGAAEAEARREPTEARLGATETLTPAEARREQARLAATETLTPAEARREPTEARLAATETLTPAKARREPTEARPAAAMSPAPAEMPKQPRECSQGTPQPQQLRDQPKGHSARQQQELEEPSPPNMDWPRSQGEEDVMHSSRRAESQDETAAEVRPCPPRMWSEDAGELGRQPKWQRR